MSYFDPKEEGTKNLPPGTILLWPSLSIPDEYLECDGSLLLRSTYHLLFDAIGETWGAGDGQTTFALPDMRGVFIRGYDHSKGYDPGRSLGSYQEHNVGWRCVYEYGPYSLDAGGDFSFSVINSIGDLHPRNHTSIYVIKYE